MPKTITSLRGITGDASDATERFHVFPGEGEWDGQGLDDLREAVIISLHTDARVDASTVPAGIANRGFWGDSFDDGHLGSELWAVQARGLTDDAAPAYAEAARQALDWLVRDGVAAKVETSATRIANGVQLTVAVYRHDGDLTPETYSYAWDPYYGR